MYNAMLCMVSIGFESVNIRQGGHSTSTDPYILRPTFSLPETSKIALKINGWKIEIPFKGPGLWPIFRGEVFIVLGTVALTEFRNIPLGGCEMLL